MRRILLAAFTVLSFASLGLMTVPRAIAQDSKSFYVVTHIDVIGAGGNLAKSIQLVKDFAADSLKDAGVLRFEIIQLEGHPNHFTIYEVWQSPKAFEAHCEAGHTKRFREALQPMLGSPFRERLHHLVSP
jgi:quinol monooxygenase YgiN